MNKGEAIEAARKAARQCGQIVYVYVSHAYPVHVYGYRRGYMTRSNKIVAEVNPDGRVGRYDT